MIVASNVFTTDLGRRPIGRCFQRRFWRTRAPVRPGPQPGVGAEGREFKIPEPLRVPPPRRSGGRFHATSGLRPMPGRACAVGGRSEPWRELV